MLAREFRHMGTARANKTSTRGTPRRVSKIDSLAATSGAQEAGSIRRLRQRVAFVGASVVDELELHLSERRLSHLSSPRIAPLGRDGTGPQSGDESPHDFSKILTSNRKFAMDNRTLDRYTDPTVGSRPLDTAPIVCNSLNCKG
jgi:hypothetical protein